MSAYNGLRSCRFCLTYAYDRPAETALVHIDLLEQPRGANIIDSAIIPLSHKTQVTDGITENPSNNLVTYQYNVAIRGI